MDAVTYIIELSSPVGNEKHSAKYYIGLAEDGDAFRRLEEHRNGTGSRMLAFAAANGIAFDVVAVIPGDWRVERALKAKKNAAGVIAKIRRGEVVGTVSFSTKSGTRYTVDVPEAVFVQ